MGRCEVFYHHTCYYNNNQAGYNDNHSCNDNSNSACLPRDWKVAGTEELVGIRVLRRLRRLRRPQKSPSLGMGATFQDHHCHCQRFPADIHTKAC